MDKTLQQRVWEYLNANKGEYFPCTAIAVAIGTSAANVSSTITQLYRKALVAMDKQTTFNEGEHRRTVRVYKSLGTTYVNKPCPVRSVPRAPTIPMQVQESLWTKPVVVHAEAEPTAKRDLQHAPVQTKEQQMFAEFLEYKAFLAMKAGAKA